MKLAALTSGGKDSILAIQKAIDKGHTVTHMITVVPENKESYMFHSANLDAVRIMAERAGMEYLEILSAGEKEAEITDMK
ncbi:MAG TPA: ATP-binding protein, partial [Methanocorpusculum sp.]|nr:ATP-binding protein [Methanocorpusculum sp.]